MPGGAPPHDIYLANISYGGQASAIGGASNVWFVGGTATGTSDFPWQMGGQGANGATGYANHNGIVGITFQGASFTNSDALHHHMECVHDTPGSDHIVVASSRFISCPVQSFFAQGTSQTNILVENNYFIGGGPLKFDCTTNPGCVNSGITIRYNSFAGTAPHPPERLQRRRHLRRRCHRQQRRLCQRRRRLSPHRLRRQWGLRQRLEELSQRRSRVRTRHLRRRLDLEVRRGFRVRVAGAAGV